MNIIDLLAEDHFKPFQKTSNEWASACPFCSDRGTDRLVLFPQEGAFGRYWCRQCKAFGDAYKYLRKYRGHDHAQATAILGVSEVEMDDILHQHRQNPGRWAGSHRASTGGEGTPEVWRAKAWDAVAACEKTLWSETPEAVHMRDWLHRERGLCDDIIREFHLGLVRRTLFRDRESWGLDGRMEADQ